MNQPTNHNLAGGFTCAAITDGNTPCGGELFDGKPYTLANIPLCEKHAAILYDFNVYWYRVRTVQQMEEEGVLNHVSGWTYIVWLPNGRIKIGTSGTTGGVVSRWKKISGKYEGKGYEEPIKPIALIPGGVTREASLHGRFNEFRIKDEFGEQFLADAELVAYAESWGIPEDMQDLVTSYEQYWKKRTNKQETEEVILFDF